MSVKITQNGIDTIQDNTVTMDKFADGQITWDDLNPGSCLQIQFANSNVDWGSQGSQAVMERGEVDITLTTRGDNSKFIVYGQISTDNVSSATYGVGVGVRLSVNNGAFTDLILPALHEVYSGGAYDMYRVARHVTEFPLSYPKETILKFRLTARFNNSNGYRFLGNGSTATTPYYGIRQIVQEIKT